MDFPVCPSCGQSVIDDDAQDCPFCGSSMKAKPGAKPAGGKPAAAATKPAAVAAAKPAVKTAAAGKPTLPGDDFPFEAELTAGKAAIQSMPNPTKQRTLQVICPMCDTSGYVPASAAGQDVRCANPKCVMPVFTAPAPKKKEEAPPPPPPKKSSNLPFIIGAVVLIGLTVGAGLYFINSIPNSQTGPAKGMSDEDRAMMAEMSGANKKPGPNRKTGPTTPLTNNKAGTVDNKAAPAEVVLGADDLIKAALAQMNASCLAKDKQQRSKPYCRQLTAEANAVLGNTAAAREDLTQLVFVGNDVTYYQITPLLDLFWADFSAGRKKEASTSLNQAMAEVPRIPKFGRTRLEIAGRLAVALAASEQLPEALKLLDSFHTDDFDGQLAAQLQIATDGRLAPLSDSYSVLPWKYPQAVAVVASLIARNQPEAALAVANGQPSEDGKAECLALWAQDLTFRKAEAGSADVEGKIAEAVKSLPPALAARVWARAGVGRSLAKDDAGAAAAIKLAQEKMAEIPAPAEVTIPIFKMTDQYKVPKAAPLIQAATAQCEIAFLQAQSASTKADAEKSLDAALAFVDATAPTLSAAMERQLEADKLGTVGLRDRLKVELKKRNDDEARLAANSFKNKLDDIVKSAQQRFELETQILSRLRGAGVGLNTKVWIVVDARTNAAEVTKRDNFMATELPGELVEGLKGTTEETAVLGAWRTRSKTEAPPRPVAAQVFEMLEGEPSKAAAYLDSNEIKTQVREEVALQASSRLPGTNKLSKVFSFIARLKHPALREDCYQLAASIAAQNGQADAVMKQVAAVSEHTEKVALCRGLIAGLKAADQKEDVFVKAGKAR